MKQTLGTDASLLFNINKPKYEVMEDVFGDLNCSTVKTVTFLVDSEKLFQGFTKQFTSIAAEEVFKDKNTMGVAVEFFEWIIHWRRYFAKKDIKTKFYILHGTNDCILEKVDPTWNSKTHHKYSKFIEFILEKRIRPIANSCRGIYILNTNKLSTPIDRARLPFFLNEQKITRNNVIIITGDLLQMSPLYKLPKHHILRINNTTCNYIGQGKIFEYISKSYKTPITGVLDNLLPYYIGIMGDDTGLEPIADTKIIRKSNLLKNLKELPVTTSDYNIPDILLSGFKLEGNIGEYRTRLVQRVEAINNFNMLSINEADKLKLLAQLEDVSPDWNELMGINATHLDNRLNIENLF